MTVIWGYWSLYRKDSQIPVRQLFEGQINLSVWNPFALSIFRWNLSVNLQSNTGCFLNFHIGVKRHVQPVGQLDTDSCALAESCHVLLGSGHRVSCSAGSCCPCGRCVKPAGLSAGARAALASPPCSSFILQRKLTKEKTTKTSLPSHLYIQENMPLAFRMFHCEGLTNTVQRHFTFMVWIAS